MNSATSPRTRAVPADLIKELGGVASLPSVYLRLVEVVNHPHSSAADISEVISSDPGLTARVLRIVNSAMYAFRSPIDTVTRAVPLLGTEQLCDLALASSAVNMFKKVPKDLIKLDVFWKHSITTGVVARALATERGEANVERFFVAGLLHDIGRLVIYTRAPKSARKAKARAVEASELLYESERALFGFDHAAVGAALLDTWNLPTALRNGVAFHHAPSSAADSAPSDAIIAATVHCADIVANALRIGSSGERFVPPLDAAAWERLGLRPPAIDKVLQTCDRQLQDAFRMILS